MGNIIPLNVPREVTVDTTVAGYHLPKVIRDSQPQIFKLILLSGRNLTQKSDMYSCPRESLNWEIYLIHFFLHVWSLEYQFNQILINLTEGKGYSQVKYDQAKTRFSLLRDLAVFLPCDVLCEYLCVCTASSSFLVDFAMESFSLPWQSLRTRDLPDFGKFCFPILGLQNTKI